jgi:23S rRNA (guanosine2251-2'-O)-methyltransferase
MRQSPPENVIYGLHAVEELLKHRIHEIDRVYFEADKTSSALFKVLKLCRKQRLSYQKVPGQRLDGLAATTKHQGVVAVCSVKAYSTIESLLDSLKAAISPPLLVVPASMEDPRNLGSLIRSCVAFGVSGLLLERKNTTLLGATVAKAAAGMMEHLTIVKPKNLEGLIGDLKLQGFSVLGARQNAPLAPEKVDFTGPSIIIIGGENRDIPPYLLRLCTHLVGIPIRPVAQSLNATVAGSILLYECGRQRGWKSVLDAEKCINFIN